MSLAAAAGLQATDSLVAEIEHLAQIASVVLNEHINQEGLCAVCGCVFPCCSGGTQRRVAVATSEAAEPGMVSHDGGISLALV